MDLRCLRRWNRQDLATEGGVSPGFEGPAASGAHRGASWGTAASRSTLHKTASSLTAGINGLHVTYARPWTKWARRRPAI
jgi:hypothetical protein